MKKMLASFLSFITIIMIFSLNAAAQTEYEEIKTDTPPEILFLGDSIATGYGLDGYKSGKENCESYANILAYKYANQLKGKCKTAMKNSAIDGQTSSELLSGLNHGIYDEDLRNLMQLSYQLAEMICLLFFGILFLIILILILTTAIPKIRKIILTSLR